MEIYIIAAEPTCYFQLRETKTGTFPRGFNLLQKAIFIALRRRLTHNWRPHVPKTEIEMRMTTDRSHSIEWQK